VLEQLNTGINSRLWGPVLEKAFADFNFNNDRRKAVAIGQFMVEAEEDFSRLEEDLNYSSAERIMQVFGSHFSNEQEAEAFCFQPEKLANRVYAKRLGNGPEDSGEGYLYRGRGLIQITGKNMYQKFADATNKNITDAVNFCTTPQGAANSACWYFKDTGCLELADKWDLDGITRRVNGGAELDMSKRDSQCEAALTILENASGHSC